MSGQTHDSTPIWQQLHCPVGSSRPIPTYLLPTLSGSNTSGDERLLSPCKTCMAFRITIIMGMQLCRDEHVGPQAPTRAALDENQYQVAGVASSSCNTQSDLAARRDTTGSVHYTKAISRGHPYVMHRIACATTFKKRVQGYLHNVAMDKSTQSCHQ